jgi:hypothetical protein
MEVSRIGQNSHTDAYIIRLLWLSLQKIRMLSQEDVHCPPIHRRKENEDG